MEMIIAEKILARASGQRKIASNDYVIAKIDIAMIPEMFRMLPAWLTKAGTKEGTFSIRGLENFVAVIDYRVPGASNAIAEKTQTEKDK